MVNVKPCFPRTRAINAGAIQIAAIISQTADPRFRDLDPGWFPALRLVVDGRNSLADLTLPARVAYRGIGVTRSS